MPQCLTANCIDEWVVSTKYLLASTVGALFKDQGVTFSSSRVAFSNNMDESLLTRSSFIKPFIIAVIRATSKRRARIFGNVFIYNEELQNMTEWEVGEMLVDQGVPKQDIVAGFLSPLLREASGYAIA